MKRIIITSILLIASLCAFASPVDKATAQAIASRWFGGATISDAGFNSDAFYAFNAKNGGWVIISADDCATPILAYNESGSISADSFPSNARKWLTTYENTISASRAQGIEPNSKVQALWKTAGYRTKASSQVVLETAHWGQDSPYNDLCPQVSEGGRNYRAVSGCVATSMAIVLRYNKWPEHGKGTIGGYSYKSDYNKTISIDSYSIDSHSYDYSLMPLSYSGAESSAQKEAVAQLMHDCGVMVEANYNYGTGTGAYSEDIVKALSEHMYYSASAQLLYRDVYTDSEWIKLIEDEINANRPILYAGSDSDNGGHAFVCDGYDTNDKIHINWGWDGSSDGFFTFDLNISSAGYKFNEGQTIIVGLVPDAEGKDVEMAGPLYVVESDEAGYSSYKGLSVTSGTVASGSFTMSVGLIWNANYNVKYNGAVKAALIDKDGNVKEYISSEQAMQIDGYYMSYIKSLPCTITKPVALSDRVVMFYKASDGSWLKMNGETGGTIKACLAPVDAAYINFPDTFKAGDTYYFEAVPGNKAIKSAEWSVDGNKSKYVGVVLSAGTHTISVVLSYSDGSSETISTQVNVK